MHLSLLAAVLLALPTLNAVAAEPAWRTISIPPEAERLNHEADAAVDPLDAARLYAQAIRVFPSNGLALYGLGRVLLNQGRAPESRTVFRRMNSFFPGDPAILEALATAIARLPEPRRADIAEGLAFAEQATRIQPDAPEAWHVLSVLRHLDGDYADAAAAARQAIALDAEHPVDLETTALFQQQEIACHDALLVFSPLD